MAFLGSLGKALGLNKQFVEGLAGGFATSVDTKFKKDMEMTQDNIDDLTKISFESTITDKKRYDKELKENTELVKEIAGIVGGKEGLKHPDAFKATHSLINQYGGVKPALAKAKNLKNHSNLYTTSPIKLMNMEASGEDSILTAKLVAESITTPVTIPDTTKLGDSANVGIMKSNWFGPAADSAAEIEKRSTALLQAAGINIDERVLPELPPAVESRIDPLVLGTQDNPTAELIRLQRIMQQNDSLGEDKDIDLQNKVTIMIDNVKNLIDSATTKKRLTNSQFDNHVKQNLEYLGAKYKLGISYKTVGSFPDISGTSQKKMLALNTSRYYTNKLAEATLKGDSKINYGNDIIQAISENKKITTYTNDAGVFILEVSDESYLSEEQQAILNEANPKSKATFNIPGKTEIKTLDDAKKSIVSIIQKNNGKLDSNQKSEARDIYVKNWKAENPQTKVQNILDTQKISYMQLAINNFTEYLKSLNATGNT